MKSRLQVVPQRGCRLQETALVGVQRMEATIHGVGAPVEVPEAQRGPDEEDQRQQNMVAADHMGRRIEWERLT